MSYTPFTDHEVININQVTGGDNIYYTTTYKCLLVVEPISLNSGTVSSPVLYLNYGSGLVNNINLIAGFGEVRSVISDSGNFVRLSTASGVCNINLHVFRID